MPSRAPDDLLKRYLDSDALIQLIIHDVRGPLTGIISASKLLNALLEDHEGISDAQINEIARLIGQAADEMRVMLEAAATADKTRRRLE